jgi:hypothetical protein
MVGGVQVETGRRRRRRREDSEQEILEAAERLLLGELNGELWEMSAGWLRGSGDPLAEGQESLERLADTFGRVGATDADRSAALETLFTIWMRTLYSPDPET